MSHDRLSPSSGHRWFLCAGSPREEAKYPDTTNPAAIDGTHSHTLLEGCLVNDCSADDYIGQELEDHEGKFVVDAERAERVNFALGYIRARAVSLDGPVAIRSESKVNPAPLMLRDDCGGTADAILVGNDIVEVIDYKDGMSPVSAQDNIQMILYALGVLAEYQLGIFKHIRMTIIQPKLRVQGHPGISHYDVDHDYMTRWCADLVQAAAATDSPHAPLTPGETQCNWCKAKGNCAAYSQMALGAAQVMFQDVGLAQQSASKDPNSLTVEQLVEIMEAKPLITQFLKGVEEEVFNRLERGEKIPGLKLVFGRGTRKWNGSDEEIADKLKRMGVPKDVIYPQKLISVAQIEKAKWTKKKKGEEVAACLSERQLKTLKDNYVTTLAGSHQVALDSDSRPEIAANAADLFKDVKPTGAAPALPDFLS